MKSVKIPLKIDALGYAPNSMKIGDLMEILKGSVQRQIHEMARSVLSEFKMRQTVSVPQAFHLYPRYTLYVINKKFSDIALHALWYLRVPNTNPVLEI